jgi:hypothetical protein
LNSGKLSRIATSKEEVVDVVDEAMTALALRLGELAHHHGEHITGRS